MWSLLGVLLVILIGYFLIKNLEFFITFAITIVILYFLLSFFGLL